jgi:hypothetical protein
VEALHFLSDVEAFSAALDRRGMATWRLSGCAISEASFQGRPPVGIASARRSNIANSRSLPASVRTRRPAQSSRPTSVYLSAMIRALRQEP